MELERESSSSKTFYSNSGAGGGGSGGGGTSGSGGPVQPGAGAGAMIGPIVPPTNASQASVTSGSKRTTVVCQECKRLKLRCDRRLPCDQCSKRNTTTKCKYSAQAAEKYDMHTLHNQQLSQLNLITALMDFLGVPADQRLQISQAPPRAIDGSERGSTEISSSSRTTVPRPFQMDVDYDALRERLFGGADGPWNALMEDGAGGRRSPTDGGSSTTARRMGNTSGHGHGGYGSGSGTRVLKPKLKVIVAFSPPPTTGSANAGSSSYPFAHTPSVLLPAITSPTNSAHRGLGGGTSASSRAGPRTPAPSSRRHHPPTLQNTNLNLASIQQLTRDKILIDLVSRAFGANSIALLIGNTTSELWTRCLGWEMSEGLGAASGVAMLERGVRWVREFDEAQLEEDLEDGEGGMSVTRDDAVSDVGGGPGSGIGTMPPPPPPPSTSHRSSGLAPPPPYQSQPAREKDKRNLVQITATPCEADYQDAPRPAKDLLALKLAFELWVVPSLNGDFGTSTVSGGSSSAGSSSMGPGPSTMPLGFYGQTTFAATGATGSSAPSPPIFGGVPGPSPSPGVASPSVPHRVSLYPSSGAPGYPQTNYVLPPTAPPPLVAPQHILQHLPSEPLRSTLWEEFKGVMILRSSALTIKLFESRVKSMFVWAEMANARGPSGAPTEDAGDAGSAVSMASSHGSGNGWETSGGRGKSNSAGKARMPPVGGGDGRGTSSSVGTKRKKTTPAPPTPRAHSSSTPTPPPTQPTTTTLPAAPTLSFYALACAAFALGAQSYACKMAHGFPIVPEKGRDGSEDEVLGDMEEPIEDGRVPVGTVFTASSGPSPSSSTFAMPPPAMPASSSIPAFALAPPLPSQGLRQLTPPIPLSAIPLPPNMTPHILHSLSRAALIAHSELDLPPNLDNILAHTLSWLFLLQPSDSVSRRTDPGFNGARTGVGSGAPTVIESKVWKEVGQMVALARTMGLGRDLGNADDEERMERENDHFAYRDEMGGDEPPPPTRMGCWEREMRRRVWWELKWWDSFVSESMGHPCMIVDDPFYPVPIPMDLDDTKFGPTTLSTHLVPPIEGGDLGQNATHFVLKCHLVQMARDLDNYSILDAHTNQLSIERAQDFEDRLNAWREKNIPDHFAIDFRPTTSEFPPDDPTATQACDIHNMYHNLVLKLWLPFLTANLSSIGSAAASSARHAFQTAGVACVTAAYNIIIASEHVLRQHRKSRPSSIAFFGFGRDVFLAGMVLSTIMIFAPNAIFADSAKKGLDLALAILKDPIISGSFDSAADQSAQQKYEAVRLLLLTRRLANRVGDRNGSATGSKRKGEDASETVKMRAGFQLPFAGGAVVSAPGEAEIVFAPQSARKKDVPRDGRSDSTTRKVRQDDIDKDDAESGGDRPSSVTGMHRGTSSSRGRTRRKTEDAHVVGEAPDGYEPPAAISTTFPPPAPPSAPPSAVSEAPPPESSSSKAAKRSSVAPTQSSSAQGVSRLSGYGANGSRPPVISVRNRIRPGGGKHESKSKGSVISGLQDARDSSGNKTSKPARQGSSAPFSDPQPPPLPFQPRVTSPLSAPSPPPSVPTNPMPHPTYYQPPPGHQTNPSQSPFHSRAPSLDVGAPQGHSPVNYPPQPGSAISIGSSHHHPPYPQDSIPQLEYHPPAPPSSTGHSPAPIQTQQQHQYASSSMSTPATPVGLAPGHSDYGLSLGMAGQQLYHPGSAGYDTSAPGVASNQVYPADNSSIPMGYDPGSGHGGGHDGKAFNPYGTPQHTPIPPHDYGAPGMNYIDSGTGFGGNHMEAPQHQSQPQPQQTFGDYPPYATHFDTDTTMAPNGWEGQPISSTNSMTGVTNTQAYHQETGWNTGM